MKMFFPALALALASPAVLSAQELKVNALVIMWYHKGLDSNLRLDGITPYYALGGSRGAGSQEPMKEDGFSLRRMELYFSTRLGEHLSAMAIFDPKENSPLLLDAFIAWKPLPAFEVKVGQFKALQGYEATSIGSPDLIFVDRSQYGRRFGDLRDRGLTVSYGWGSPERGLKVTAGLFNGVVRDNDANARKDYVLRVDAAAGAHKAGVYGLLGGTDAKDSLGLATVPDAASVAAAWGNAAPSRPEILDHRDRTTNLGAYYRFDAGPWHADAEAVTGELGRRFPTLATASPALKREHLAQRFLSCWASATYRLAPRHLLTARYDLLDLNAGDDWYTPYNPYTHSAPGVRRTVNGSPVDLTPRFAETTLGYTFLWDPASPRKANVKLNYVWRSGNVLLPRPGQVGEQGGDSLVAALQVYF